jgi:hypothetical protein
MDKPQAPYRKNRPRWRVPTSSGTPNARPIAGRSTWGAFEPGNGRTQCKAVARSTGKRCGLDALQGATACRVHGGYGLAYRRQREALDRVARPMVTLSGARSPRRALAAIGATVSASPDGRPLPLSPVERGRMVETGDLDLTGRRTHAGETVGDPAAIRAPAPDARGAETGDLSGRPETGDRKA